MKWKTITNDQEYEAALRRLSPIYDADPESPEGNEAEQLVNLITEYEKVH
ncbi:transcriptional regulator [Algoriphagus persicinus]|nr:transcriptional regulator [Algoriphagus sp. E1-3-M2]MEB2784218.1 transcriptional regulator [Algoriphagus sp. E1-3-M2]